jgi:RNA polymerase sigma factor (sigma-70 family)
MRTWIEWSGEGQLTDHGLTPEQVLRDLIETHGRTVRVVIARFERNPPDIDEVWADVFELAHRKLDELTPLAEAQVRAWLLRTAKYLASNHGRRSASRRRLFERLSREPLAFSVAADDEFAPIVEEGSARRRADAIAAAMASLRDDHRQVLVLHALGNDGNAIAAAVGITAASARKKLMHARVAFREAYLAIDPDSSAPDSSASDSPASSRGER